jgi:hypothetical protein
MLHPVWSRCCFEQLNTEGFISLETTVFSLKPSWHQLMYVHNHTTVWNDAYARSQFGVLWGGMC